jgi:GTP diphosphokinase / guanosine-3',5'-bis(diphosphate) 3'-diphosphatase
LQALLEDEVFINNIARVEVKGRVKQPYSVWKKLKRRNCTIDDIYDVVALRVVCTPLPEEGMTPEQLAQKGRDVCYYVRDEVVHKLRPHVPQRVKDFIQEPKQNGYQVSTYPLP